MVNEIKVQQEVIKSPLSTGGTLSDGRQYISFDGVAAFIIRDENLKVDLKKLKQVDYRDYFAAANDAKEARATGTTKIIGKNPQRECAEFQTGDGELVYIQKKYLKYFDRNTSFRVLQSKYVMYAFDQYDELCGLICTVQNK